MLVHVVFELEVFEILERPSKRESYFILSVVEHRCANGGEFLPRSILSAGRNEGYS